MSIEQELATVARRAWERLQRGPVSHDGAWSLGHDLEPVVQYLEDLAAGQPVAEGPSKVSIVDVLDRFTQAMDDRMKQLEQRFAGSGQQQLPSAQQPPSVPEQQPTAAAGV